MVQIMAETPLVSVILTTYNRAALLPRAINSVLAQTYQNFELIIIDGGSTDDTEEVMRSFNDPRIRRRRQEENRGMLADRNRGLDLAAGDYIAILDDDDELLPEALKTVVDEFARLSAAGVGVLFFNCTDYVTGKFTGIGMEEDGYISYEDHLCGRIGGEFWPVMDRRIIDGMRFDERLWGLESIFWLKLYKKCKFYYIHTALRIYHREHGGNVCNFENQARWRSRITLAHKVFLEEYGNDLKRLCPKRYGYRLGLLGSSQILDGDTSEGRKNLFLSFKYDFSTRYLLLFFMSFVLSNTTINDLHIKYLNLGDRKS